MCLGVFQLLSSHVSSVSRTQTGRFDTQVLKTVRLSSLPVRCRWVSVGGWVGVRIVQKTRVLRRKPHLHLFKIGRRSCSRSVKVKSYGIITSREAEHDQCCVHHSRSTSSTSLLMTCRTARRETLKAHAPLGLGYSCPPFVFLEDELVRSSDKAARRTLPALVGPEIFRPTISQTHPR